MKEIAITTNTESLMKALSVTFTNKSKVLTELIQNARRAGSSSVAIDFETDNESNQVTKIVITDNGTGIESLQDLFTIGGSGWDDAVTANENPYGIGSISMLFACERLIVESGEQKIDVLTDDVKKGKSFKPKLIKKRIDGVQVQLIDTVFCHKEDSFDSDLITKFNEIARYSSIPITVNGEELKRNYSYAYLNELPNYTLLKTSVGDLLFTGELSTEYRVILQDLKVGHSTWQRSINCFFVDSSFKARMPDRDALVDSEEQIKRINQAIKEAAKPYLLNEKKKHTDTESLNQWVKRNFTAITEFYPELLNDIDYLPCQAFSAVEYPNQRDIAHTSTVCVYREEHNSNVFSQLCADGLPIVEAALHKQDVQYLNRKLDNGHWIYKEYEAFDIGKVRIDITSGRKIEEHCLYCYGYDISIGVAESIIVHYQDWSINIEDGACLFNHCTEDDYWIDDDITELDKQLLDLREKFGSMIFTSTDNIDAILLQYNSYKTENEDFDEMALDNDVQEFENVLSAEFGVKADVYILKLLKGLPTPIQTQLKERGVTIFVNANGEVIAA